MVKNNKGFMLAEVVIVSTVIITTLVALYASVNRLYMLYSERSTYYNIDGVYAIKEIMDYLFDDNRLNNILSSDSFEEDNYIFLVSNSTCGNINGVDLSLDNGICDSLNSLYEIKNLVIVGYSDISAVISLDINNTFKDYLEYLENYYSNDDSFSYLVILEYGDDDNLNYSNLRLR